MKEFSYNLKLMLSRNEYFIAILFIFLLEIIHPMILLSIYHNNSMTNADIYPWVYQTSLVSNLFGFGLIHMLIFPVINSFGIASIAFEENKNHVNSHLKLRLNIKKSLIAKVILVFLTTLLISFGALFINGIICKQIFPAGNYADTFGSGVYLKITYPFLFLENLRTSSQVLYFVALAFTISIILSLLNVFTLLVSYFIKTRIYVYFSSLILLVGSSMILGIIGLEQYSLLSLMQYPGIFTFQHLLTTLFILAFINIIFIQICLKRIDLNV